MTKILHLDSGLLAENSRSNQLSARFVNAFTEAVGASQVLRRDLAAEPLPHLDAATLGAFVTPAEKRSSEQQAAADRSDRLIAELQAADVLVIGLPMYNFSIPSTLKAWIDHVARAGLTFRYTENGPEGLLDGKKAYLLAARGGFHREDGSDFQVPYLKHLLAFIGITDVTTVYAEGLNIDADVKAAALAAAATEIDELTQGLRQAA